MKTTQDLFNSYREHSTAKLQYECDMGIVGLPEIPVGNNKAIFKVGDIVRMTNESRILPSDETFKITEIYFEAGNPRYILNKNVGIYSFLEKEIEGE